MGRFRSFHVLAALAACVLPEPTPDPAPGRLPLVKGGQGRSGAEIRRAAMSTARVLRTGAAAMLLVGVVSLV